MEIRTETPKDYRTVEELTRKAFWNHLTPGCNEHYFVHTMRSHPDFLPELALVLEEDGRILANVMYLRAKLIDEEGREKEILSFGPLSVLPGCQRQGYGKKLLEFSFARAAALGYDTVVIWGNPENYVSRGFKSCKKYGVSTAEGVYPVSLLVKELSPGALQGHSWVFRESPACEIDEKKAEEFDKGFEALEKGYRPSQELFYIYSHSVVK